MAVLVFSVGPALAVEPLSTEELVSHCTHYPASPDGEDAIFCVRYIQGFIDGAVATDERVTLNVAADFSREETFTQRAIRTRGSNRLAQYGPTVYAEFCLGAPLPLRSVVEQVVRDLDAYEAAELPVNARDAVYTSLRGAYPCATEVEP
jgi:hypothetical protein